MAKHKKRMTRYKKDQAMTGEQMKELSEALEQLKTAFHRVNKLWEWDLGPDLYPFMDSFDTVTEEVTEWVEIAQAELVGELRILKESEGK